MTLWTSFVTCGHHRKCEREYFATSRDGEFKRSRADCRRLRGRPADNAAAQRSRRRRRRHHREFGAAHVAYVGTGGAMLPLLIFASARAGLTFTPINYRLSADGIKTLIARLPDPLVVIDSRYLDELGGPDGLEGWPSRSSCPTTFWRRPATPSRPWNSPTRTRSASCCSPRAPHRSPKPSSSPTTT